MVLLRYNHDFRNIAWLIDGSFDETFLRSSPSIRKSILVRISKENQSKISFECGSEPTSASKSILGAFLTRFSALGGASGSPWVALDDPWGSLGQPWGLQETTLGPLRLLWVAPRSLWGASGDPPGLPWGSRGRSGRFFTFKTAQNGRFS